MENKSHARKGISECRCCGPAGWKGGGGGGRRLEEGGGSRAASNQKVQAGRRLQGAVGAPWALQTLTLLTRGFLQKLVPVALASDK